MRTEKLALHAAINSGVLAFADGFFRVVTHVGDGLVPTLLALLFLVFCGIRPFLMMGLGCGLGAIVVQLVKRLILPDMDRPAMFRDQLPGMHWVAGIDWHHHNSFPSGHTAAAFGMCLALVVILGRRSAAVPLLLLAALIGYSRIHLSQHFTEDVFVGSLIGTAISYGVYRWLYRPDAPAWTTRGPLWGRGGGRK